MKTILAALTLVVCATAAHAAFPATEVFLPAVGRVEGSGTQFYTTVWVTNPSSTATVDVQIQYLIAGQRNLNPATFTDSIGPRETKTYENFAETVFGIVNVLGAARLRSSSEILVSARIYSKQQGDTDARTYGGVFSAIPARFAVGAGELATLHGGRQNADFRYNIFVVETTGNDTSVTLTARRSGGSSSQLTLALGAFEQRIVPLGAIASGDFSDGSIEAAVTGGNGRIVLAGSQITNGSSDS
ncbi:MAG TPA: hypothetical protein VE010_21455, partial [Thermoanaerobaculia bacterium]|nr:hypothetical protein [Thermoanaerobaculia bacterium]